MNDLGEGLWNRAYEEAYKEAYEEAVKKGRMRVWVQAVRKLMEKQQISMTKAMDLLEIPENARKTVQKELNEMVD